MSGSPPGLPGQEKLRVSVGASSPSVGVSLALDKSSPPGEPSAAASAPPRRSADRPEHNGYLARLIVLGAALVVGLVLRSLSAGSPYYIFMVLGSVLLICVAMVVLPHRPTGLLRLTVPLLDVAWIMFAMHLTNGPQSVLLPLLYVVVATAAMRGDRWEMGLTAAGAITAIYVLAVVWRLPEHLAMAAVQAALLAAGGLAVRLMATSDVSARGAERTTRELYDALTQATSDAVLTLDPDWKIREANPAALSLLGNLDDEEAGVEGQALDSLLEFTDTTFLGICRHRLDREESIRGSLTTVQTRDGHQLSLSFSAIPVLDGDRLTAIQAIIGVSEDVETPGQSRHVWPGHDFATHYIPSLTHELNNHLAGIRLSAELAETTGRQPDYRLIQEQVDHCQDVLRTVVAQILRASMPGRDVQEEAVSDLRSMIEHALLLTRSQVLSTSVQLQLRVPEGRLPQVRGHSYELQESLVRLILHCVRSMVGQEPPRALTFAVDVREHLAEITLIDVGPGLKWHELAAINGHGVLSRSEQRAWSVVREGIVRHGGSLSATNGLNGGARFKISLPLAGAE